jgi:hypothetical protein
MNQPTAATPIACDMTTAADTGQERFLEYERLFITTDGHEVLWDASVIDDDIARDILEEFYGLPDNIATGLDGFENRLTQRGLRITANAAGTITEVRSAESAASRLPGL